MKVCVLGLRGLPDVLGGVETHCEKLLPAVLAQMPGAAIEVLVRRPYQPPIRRFRGLALRPLWCVKQKHLEALSHTALGVLYARFAVKPDILHIHAIGPGLMTPLARALGLRVVVTHHGADYERAKWKRTARAALRLGEWLAVRCADRVIVVSPSAARALARRFPRAAHKIAYIPNGAALEREANPSVLPKLGLAPGGYVLAVGRLVPEKGFDDLIAAFDRSGIGGKLVIAGAADHDDAYARKLRAQASARVIFAGFQDRAALAALYRAASLFVLPSRHEGLPIAALEALAAEAPILLSAIEAHRDIGLPERNYFPAGDVDALAARLRCAHGAFRNADPALIARYDWAAIARETRAIYEGVARPC
jgi:glycosyltransferase involved in cell wall biosynthesis